MPELRTPTHQDSLPGGPPGLLFAVQQDAQVGAVVWQLPPDADAGRREPFQGTVFILDNGGAQLAGIDWDDPTDQSADTALVGHGLRRTEPWRTDAFGRRIAAIAAEPGMADGSMQLWSLDPAPGLRGMG